MKVTMLLEELLQAGEAQYAGASDRALDLACRLDKTVRRWFTQPVFLVPGWVDLKGNE
jgi:hypothetical protein